MFRPARGVGDGMCAFPAARGCQFFVEGSLRDLVPDRGPGPKSWYLPPGKSEAAKRGGGMGLERAIRPIFFPAGRRVSATSGALANNNVSSSGDGLSYATSNKNLPPMRLAQATCANLLGEGTLANGGDLANVNGEQTQNERPREQNVRRYFTFCFFEMCCLGHPSVPTLCSHTTGALLRCAWAEFMCDLRRIATGTTITKSSIGRANSQLMAVRSSQILGATWKTALPPDEMARSTTFTHGGSNLLMRQTT